MFIALDKLQNQGIKRVVVAVPEKSIGRSFKNTNLTNSGFFANWEVASYFNLTDVKNEQDLREAHAKLDDIVESCYPGYPFASDEARLECLFKLYEKMTAKK